MSDEDTQAATAVADPAAVEQPTAPEPAPEQPKANDAEANLRRELAEAQRKAKRLEEQQKKEAEAKAAEQGEWQKLAEERAAELERERTERNRVEREQRLTRLASRMKFIDPQDAIYRVRGESADTDESAQRALEAIAEGSPHLIAKDPPVAPEIGQVLAPSAPGLAGDGRPSPPAGKAPLLSLDEAMSLPQTELVARMDEIEWLERQEQGRR